MPHAFPIPSPADWRVEAEKALKGRPVVTEKRVFQNLGRDYVRRETARHALEMGLTALE